MKKIISPKHIALLAVGVAVGLGATYAMAWTAPTVAPTGGNVAAPINTSATPQSKTGTFGTQGLLNAGNKITTTGLGLAGMITGRSVRATQNGGFEIVGQPTGWMAAKQFCLTNNPATGLPGDSGYDCVSAASGWSGVPGTVNGSHMYYDLAQGWTEATKIRLGFIPGGNGYGVAINWGNNDIISSPISSMPSSPSTSTELDVNGKVRIRGGSPATNKVLTANSGIGDAVWSSIGSQVVTVHANVNGRRVVAMCPGVADAYRAIGGGGLCTNSDSGPVHISVPAMIQSAPIDRTDATATVGLRYNNVALPGVTTTPDAWMVACYDEALQHAYVICVPAN